MGIVRGIFDYCGLNAHLYKYSRKKVENYQLREIKKLLAFVTANSKFYNELYSGFKVETIEDFHKLPAINKKIMLDNFDLLNTCGLKLDEVTEYAVTKELNKDYYGYYKGKYVIGLSSGTSGNKGIYITPKSLTKRLPAVFLARSGLSLKNLPFKILFMLRVFSQGFSDINSPLVRLKYLSTMTSIDEIINTINQLNINILMAPPSMIRVLVPHAHRITSKIVTVVTYAEVLYDEDKELFAKTFKTKIIQIYQASEGQIASACKYGNLHINEDLVYIELYDRENRLIIESGTVAEKMILTNLVNSAQPLIRYEMNDLILLDTKCPCGSNFRTIRKILGRNDDIIFLENKDGKLQYIFPDLFSRWIITSSNDIREFKVISKNGELIIYIDLLNDKMDKGVFYKILDDRIRKELLEFRIEKVKIEIIFKKLELPTNMSKYKRFERYENKNGK